MQNDLINHDQQARIKALDITQSFIVQAPAGSGKTELIIQRFLRLLSQVNRPEEILAITFTKKAANEMRHRIIKALKEAHVNHAPPESPHAKLTWQLARAVLKRDQQYEWRLIDNPNQLHLHTIDALCSFLTKQLPLLSHFGSTPEIEVNPEMLYREASENTLNHLEGSEAWSKDLANLLIHLDNHIHQLQTLLIKLFAKRDQWLSYLHWDGEEQVIRQVLEANFQAVIREHLSLLTELFPQNLQAELIAMLHYAANQLILIQKNNHPEIIACLQINTLPKTHYADLPYWRGIAKILLTTDKSWRKSFDVRIGFPAASSVTNLQEKKMVAAYKKRIACLVNALNDHEQLRLALSELDLLPDPCYANEQWDILTSLLRVLKLGAAELRLTFERHGRIDFIENAQAALLALGNDDHPTDLALLLDYRIQHILIDEFQDTSFSQFQLLEKLIYGWQPDDGRTLFVVGDPTQSIYRFRQAEVGLFMRMCESGIGQITLTPLTLTVNFRSAAQIVAWNNQQFLNLFPRYQDIAKGAVMYNPCVAHQSATNSMDAKVMMQGLVNSNDAATIKAIIHQIMQTKQNYPTENIAVLVRSRSHLSLLISELKKSKINYRAVDIDPLATRQVIQDLLSLTFAMHHMGDRIAWLAVLRAPWCGLTLAGLHAIAHADPKASIWAQCESALSSLDQDNQQRLIHVMTILKSKIAERARYDLRTWIESTWLLLGGPAALLDAKDLDDAHAFFSLLDDCHQDFEKFSLERLKDKIATLYAPVIDDDHTLQIMTIHSAKGLEFDTVILPHLERKTPSDQNPLLAWMERSVNQRKALLLAPIHATGMVTDAIYHYINYQHKMKADYETDRLLYVAATRAKKRLYLFFNITQNEKKEYRTEKGSFLSKLWPLLKNQEKEWRVNSAQSDLQSSEIIKKQRVPRALLRLKSDWKNPIQEIMTCKMATDLDPHGFRLVNEDLKRLGIVIHAVLQNLAERGLDWWQMQNKNKQMHYLRYHLQQQNILPQHLEKNMLMAFSALEKTLNDQRGLWILKAHASSRSEYAITALIKNEPMSLVIDRTFVDEHGVRWIIDYKTTTFSNADLNAFLQQEQQKYLQKMKLYQEAMRALDDRPSRLGLYFPALPAWYAWE